MKRIAIALGLALLAAGVLPAAAASPAKTERAVFGAGCFWCVEAFFERQPGVVNVVSGYAGGTESNPTYEQVGSGGTGHAEVVEIEFDPSVTSYEKLVDFFWKTHDPTDPRGVWPDFGRQYRSIILYRDEGQRKAAERSKAAAQTRYDKPIATEFAKLKTFWSAEGYHQDYVRNNPGDRYVQQIAVPKLKKLGLK